MYFKPVVISIIPEIIALYGSFKLNILDSIVKNIKKKLIVAKMIIKVLILSIIELSST